MALHIMPANELHKTTSRCSCRPRKVPHARRTAWKHNGARPVRKRASAAARSITITVHHNIELDSRRLHEVAAAMPRTR